MFDIGFLELMVVAIVGLLVIGPEKLPEAIRSCAMWIGRIKRVLRDARSEFEQQIGADEIRREIHNEQVLKSLQKLKEQREEIERQIRSAAATEEEKYEDMHLVHQGRESHAPLPDLDAVTDESRHSNDHPYSNDHSPPKEQKATEETTATEPGTEPSAEEINKPHGA